MQARIRMPQTAKRGEVIEVAILIQHPMETGFRRDFDGALVRRNCVNALACRYNGVEVFRADLSSGIAANPFLSFFTVAEATGELVFTWIDDDYREGSARAAITVA
jgi:sulfur-oxidizing protein SoxZ